MTHDSLIGILNTFLTTNVHESYTVLKSTDNRSQFSKWSSFLGEVTNTIFDESNWNQREISNFFLNTWEIRPSNKLATMEYFDELFFQSIYIVAIRINDLGTFNLTVS